MSKPYTLEDLRRATGAGRQAQEGGIVKEGLYWVLVVMILVVSIIQSINNVSQMNQIADLRARVQVLERAMESASPEPALPRDPSKPRVR